MRCVIIESDSFIELFLVRFDTFPNMKDPESIYDLYMTFLAWSMKPSCLDMLLWANQLTLGHLWDWFPISVAINKHHFG